MKSPNNHKHHLSKSTPREVGNKGNQIDCLEQANEDIRSFIETRCVTSHENFKEFCCDLRPLFTRTSLHEWIMRLLIEKFHTQFNVKNKYSWYITGQTPNAMPLIQGFNRRGYPSGLLPTEVNKAIDSILLVIPVILDPVGLINTLIVLPDNLRKMVSGILSVVNRANMEIHALKKYGHLKFISLLEMDDDGCITWSS